MYRVGAAIVSIEAERGRATFKPSCTSPSPEKARYQLQNQLQSFVRIDDEMNSNEGPERGQTREQFCNSDVCTHTRQLLSHAANARAPPRARVTVSVELQKHRARIQQQRARSFKKLHLGPHCDANSCSLESDDRGSSMSTGCEARAVPSFVFGK